MLTRRRFIKTCIASALALGSMPLFSSISKVSAGYSSNIPVLLYHRIGDTDGPLTISPKKFETDLARLRQLGYTTITLDTFRNYLGNDEANLPAKPIMISFDDGYLDNYMNAYLLLRKYGMTAAFYIITSAVGGEDRLAAGHIREMAANGMSIGSHTVSHRALGDMGYDEAENELLLSRAYLEGLLQRTVDFIAYPLGSYNRDTIAAANEAGYAGGFSVIPGTCSHNTNPYILKRIPEFSFDGDIRFTMAKYGAA